MKKFKKDFYSVDADELAVNLLGKALVRKTDEGERRFLIAETECYMGIEDTACHAAKGKTARTEVLWERGGLLYVHLIYGLHFMLNIVAGKEGSPMGVLVRGVGQAAKQEINQSDKIKGPGLVARALRIDKSFNKEDLTVSDRIWLEDGLTPRYKAAPRIGIGYASPQDRDRLWRFVAYDYL